MSQHQRKRLEIRNHIRQKEVDQYKNQKRQITIQTQLDLQQYEKQGRYGTYLLLDILHRSQDKDEVKELQKKYPLQSFYQFLDSIYDGTQWQLSAIKIIENYFYAGFQAKPDQIFVDKALRILLQSTNTQILNLLLLTFSDILEDNLRYGNFLIAEKQFIQALLTLLQKFPNNRLIITLTHRVIHSLIFSVDWDDRILKLIDPLFRMMYDSHTVEITIYIETLYSITQFKPKSSEIANKIYQKGILKICINVINQYHSRLTSYHFIEFAKMLKSLLNLDQIKQIISIIAVMRDFNFKIGDQTGKYSVLSIRTNAYALINNFLRQSQDEISQFVLKQLNQCQLSQKLYKQFEQAYDLDYGQDLFRIIGKIILFFYSKTQQENFYSHKYRIAGVLQRWQGTDVGQYLLCDFETISEYLGSKVTQMEMEEEEIRPL